MPANQPLPIDPILPEIVAELRRASNVVLRVPLGAGKTTRLPPASVDSSLTENRMTVVVEPRRLAATSAARRVALERNVPLGSEVGYHVRFDRKAQADSRLLFVTEGILLRWLQDDPFLDLVGAVIFDEFHERRLASDLALSI